MSQLSSVLFFFAGTLSLATGLLVTFRPWAIKKLNLPLGELSSILRSSISTERWYYRHHSITGPLTALGGAALFLAGWTVYGLGVPSEGWQTILQTLGLFFLVFSPGAIVLGLVVFIRPSALKPFECWANRAITRERIKNLVIRFRLGVVGWTVKQPRTFGVLSTVLGFLLFICALL